MYYPSNGKENIIIFIDDLNLAIADKCGTQPPLELLRQLLEDNSFYDLETKEFKSLNNFILISALNLTYKN